MDDYKVLTPEQVNISYSVAGLGTRFLALAIDMTIQSVLVFILAASFYAASFYGASNFWTTLEDWYMAIVIIIFALIYYLYFLIFELILKGRTPGKAALKIRVVRMDGRAVDVSGTVIRNLIRLIDFLPSFYAIGTICMFVNKDSRRLGDIVAGTIVIRDERKVTLSAIMSEQARMTQTQTQLSDNEYALVRDFLARRKHLSKKVRHALAHEIANSIFESHQTSQERRDSEDPEAFLESLLK